jgi:hypothetical protein
MTVENMQGDTQGPSPTSIEKHRQEQAEQEVEHGRCKSKSRGCTVGNEIGCGVPPFCERESFGALHTMLANFEAAHKISHYRTSQTLIGLTFLLCWKFICQRIMILFATCVTVVRVGKSGARFTKILQS